MHGCMLWSFKKKIARGLGFATPKHKDLFFGDQNDVDNFVDHYSETSVSEHVCCYTFLLMFYKHVVNNHTLSVIVIL